MRKVFFLLNAFIIIALVGCVGTKYTAPNFNVTTSKHKLIAILPFDMVYNGKNPDGLTTSDIESMRYAEGVAFQKSLYDNLSKQIGTGKKDIKIEIQLVENTNKLLQEKGLNYNSLSTTTPAELCKKLGVDAVVISKIEKERFLSDLESFGISITKELLDKLKGKNAEVDQTVPAIPGNVARSYHLKSDCQLKNSEDGTLLWQYSFETDADWQTPATNIITLVTHKTSKKFPYRKR